MEKSPQADAALTHEVQEAIRSLIAAIRVVKIYPPNNPVYGQTIKKGIETILKALEEETDLPVTVQRTFFAYRQFPIGKEAQLNKTIAQDLFSKGVREILFTRDLEERELLMLCRAVALSADELAMRSGVSSVLWEEGATHVKVTEAELDEIVTTDTSAKKDGVTAAEAVPDPEAARRATAAFQGRTLVLSDILADPKGFAASMLAIAERTKGPNETVEDRLLTLYREAAAMIGAKGAADSESLFDGLAQSVLALEPPYRDRFVMGTLFGGVDADLALVGVETSTEEQHLHVPSIPQELRSARVADALNVKQVATLLQRSLARKVETPSAAPTPDTLLAEPIPTDTPRLIHELTEYNADELAKLKELSGLGMESDIIAATTRTLIRLLPNVANPLRPPAAKSDLHLFSGVVRQLEDLLGYLLKKNQYEQASLIIKALHQPVDPPFRPRLAEALKKSMPKHLIREMIEGMRKHPKGSPEHESAYTYLANIERRATEVLIDLLAEEKDKDARLFMLDLLKGLGKNQVALLGNYLSDTRWYVVRNIVALLGETGSDEAIALLRKAGEHENARVRTEVIATFQAMGGRKAAVAVSRFLRDLDGSVRLAAVKALAGLQGLTGEDSRPLIELLESLQLKQADQELVIESIKTLGKIGGGDARDFLQRYVPIKWWRPRQLQLERSAAARHAMDEIGRRKPDGGR